MFRVDVNIIIFQDILLCFGHTYIHYIYNTGFYHETHILLNNSS